MIMEERIGSPLAFFLTGLLLEFLFTFVIFKYTQYVMIVAIAFGILALISIFKVSKSNEKLNCNIWINSKSDTMDG